MRHTRAVMIYDVFLSMKTFAKELHKRSVHINCKADDTSNYEKHAN